MKHWLFIFPAIVLLLLFQAGCTRTVRLWVVDSETGQGIAAANIVHRKDGNRLMNYLMLLPAGDIELGSAQTDVSGRAVLRDVPWEGWFSVEKEGYSTMTVGQTWPVVQMAQYWALGDRVTAKNQAGYSVIPLTKGQ